MSPDPGTLIMVDIGLDILFLVVILFQGYLPKIHDGTRFAEPVMLGFVNIVFSCECSAP